MKTDDFDYVLPKELIAKYPLQKRDQSKLLVVDRNNLNFSDTIFTHLVDYLSPKDLLVFNNSKVMAARLFGKKETGGAVELLIERIESKNFILAHIKANKAPKIGSKLEIHNLVFEILSKCDSLYKLKILQGNIWETMERYGHIPLPPYMNRRDEKLDLERYQTVYSKDYGSVAAPTAGLHFTDELIKKVEQKGVNTAYLTLHVGSGTFQPVKVNDVNQHKMHSEYIEVSGSVCDLIKKTKVNGGRVFAVGTTTVRSLETAALNGEISPYFGTTDIFLYPGKSFNVVDAMVTNFHLPKSTLIMLVSAFASKQRILDAYQYAIEQSYRFYSYGDAMLIL